MDELQVLNISSVDCYEKDGMVYLKLEAGERVVFSCFFGAFENIRSHLLSIGSGLRTSGSG